MTKIVPCLLTFLLLSVNANAKGVEAGTDITNIATLEYQIGGVTHNISSNSVVDRVDQLIDVNVIWQDAAPIVVSSGNIARVLEYKITNTGNGNDTFALSHLNDSSSNFDVQNPRIYNDTNNNGLYDVDDLPVSDISLSPDGYATIFLLSDIPNATLPNASQSKNIIKAISQTGGSGATGTVHTGAGVNSVDAVDGFSGGRSEAIGIYEINNIKVKLNKSASTNTSEVFTGSIITYSIVVTIEGNGKIDGLKITDAIPAKSSYVPGSLAIDGVGLSDAVDSDIGSMDSGVVAFNLGVVEQSASTPYSKTITFQVRID